MATTRTAHTVWNGNLIEGAGNTTLDSSGLGTYDVTWKARAESAEGKTSPEELIAAAHSACFSMAFSNGVAGAGFNPEEVNTKADVTFQPGEGITGIHLTVSARISGVTEEEFQRLAEDAKVNCPVSQALRATPITLTATLAA
ncbi:OsmC family protein [Arthrobacter cavernae]|uniref:OsmC family protein n=1 Tax=Arthrobacter cavernae TaxID=2817681 RepID=A0A939HLB1_9MICC|nr:OsmC family protein [Arthrobacter cavernae]MBO1269393.1 OsmC family protein [Arthrobacter cavernae]